jgi:hypothetical protein
MGITKPRSPASGNERAQNEDYCAWQDIPASQTIKSALTHRDCHVVESEVTTLAFGSAFQMLTERTINLISSASLPTLPSVMKMICCKSSGSVGLDSAVSKGARISVQPLALSAETKPKILKCLKKEPGAIGA